MGVEGLKHYVLWHRKCCLQEMLLHDCRVFIDGSNLAYLLYQRAPGVLPAYGGDYDKYAAYITFFFKRLQSCNIEATVIMDGGQPRHNIKLHTCTTRLQTTLETCLDSAPLPPHSRVFPLHARAVFTQVLRRLGVPVLQSDAEADRDLAFLAPHFDASVISNDSDFFLYGVKFIPLDFLRFTNLKKIVNKDGSCKYMISCKVFLQDKFLQLSSLKRRHLGLLGALSGNDCVPATQLGRFHRRLVEGNSRSKTHTRRQNVIRYVLLFLKHNRHVDTAALVDKACDMAGGDDKLKELLLLVADSYRPRYSSLSYWLQRLYPSTAPQSSTSAALLSSGSGQGDNVMDHNSSKGEEVVQLCTCERPWAHVYGGSPFGARLSRDGQDLSNLCEEDEVGDDPVSDADDLPEDDVEDALSISSLSDEDQAPTEDTFEQNDASSLTEKNSDAQDDSSNVEMDSTAGKVRQMLTKKGRKNELQEIRLLRKMKKKISKKSELPPRNTEANKGHRGKLFDPTGMNSEQILRELEKAEKGNESDDDKESIDSDFFPLNNHLSAEARDEVDGAECSLLQLSQCGHDVSSLITDSGFRLPGWLVYGHRHSFVTREISDIVTNSFCISQPQVENMHLPSSYKCVEPLWKMIVVMVRGGGYVERVAKYSAAESCKGITVSLGGGGAASSVPRCDALASSSATFNPKTSRRKARKNPNIIRWFIRKKKDLHIENISLDTLLLNLNLETPSLMNIELMPLEERKKLYLRLALGTVPDDLLELPDEVALVLSFVCYWYKNSVSNLSENHLLSVLFTFFIFYFVYGNAQRIAHKGPRIFCLHCCLANYCSGFDNEKLKFIIQNLECLRSDFNWGSENEVPSSDKRPTRSAELNEVLSSDKQPVSSVELSSTNGPTVSDLLSRVDRYQWGAVSRAVSTFHSSPALAVKAYNKRFVHSMSEFQACVHYLTILNGLFIVPFTPVSMDQIWSGTFCYGVYTNLCHLADGGVNLIPLILGQNSPAMQLFVIIYKAVLKVLGLQFHVPDTDASPETAAEQALKAMFRKSTLGAAEQKKQSASRKSAHERKRARTVMQEMNDVPA